MKVPGATFLVAGGNPRPPPLNDNPASSLVYFVAVQWLRQCWIYSGGSRGGGAQPPLIFRPNWVPKDRKHFFGYWALPPLSRGLDDWASPLSRDLESALTYLHFWLSCYCRCRWILSVLNSSSSAHYFGLLIHLCFRCCLSWYLRAKCPWGQERGETVVFAG